jgi:hypothetical protein
MHLDNNIQVFPTTSWSAGAGCQGACGQKLYVQNGTLDHITTPGGKLTYDNI